MHHEWGRLIVLYLFLGGLSAGTLIVSSVATLAGRAPRIARSGALSAPLPVLIGTGLLVLDLGQPFYFWKLLVAFQPRSPMWIGTWLLTLFAFVSVPYAALFMPWLSPAPREAERRRTRLAIAGLPVGIGVGLYTGILLSVLVARPLWNTPVLAQLFLVSALSTGTALLIVMLRDPAAHAERQLLVGADVVLIGVELLLIAVMFLAGRTSTASASAAVGTLAAGRVGLVFWLVVVLSGLVAPLGIEVAGLRGRDRPASRFARFETIAAVLVLVGGLALRWVFVAAGQASALVASAN